MTPALKTIVQLNTKINEQIQFFMIKLEIYATISLHGEVKTFFFFFELFI